MKTQINQKIEKRLRQFSPAIRLVTVLIVVVILAAINIYFLFSTIRGIAKNDAQKDLMKIRHINDSIK